MAYSSKSPNSKDLLVDAGFQRLPDGWSVTTVGALLAEDRGISVGVMYPGNHDPGGVPLIRAADLAGNVIAPQPEFRISETKHHEYRRTELDSGELLVSLVGDIGRCAVVPAAMRGWNAARAIAVLRFAEARDADFVRVCLLSPPLQHLMRAWATTTVQATLNLKEIRQLPLPWPSWGERDEIVRMLRALDDKIELNRRMNRTLESIARAIFTSWFVDFDPAAILAEPLRESRPRDVPFEWEIGTLSDVADLNPESWTKSTRPTQLLYVDLSSVKDGRIDAVAECSSLTAPSRAQRVLRQGDTVVGTVRPGNRSYALIQREGLTGSTGFAVLRPRTREFREIVYLAATADDSIASLAQLADGGAYPAVRPEVVASTPIAVPPIQVAARFSSIVSPLLERMAVSETQDRLLAGARERLLPRLLANGLAAKN